MASLSKLGASNLTLSTSYFDAAISNFSASDPAAILGLMAQAHGFALEHQQRDAWVSQIECLKDQLVEFTGGHIFFEFSIPRMGKRADAIVFKQGVVYVIEFKVGASAFDLSSKNQVHDYALDLKNFHRGSHNCLILPILVATQAADQVIEKIDWASDGVAAPVCINASQIGEFVSGIDNMWASDDDKSFSARAWSLSGYEPTPTIVEAAQALYRDHDVTEITRSDAGAKNLAETTDAISGIIEQAKELRFKAICFVTGVPGSGKTLAGLNIATQRAETHSDEHAVFLSGNGPLVAVLREALARDKAVRDGITKADAKREVSTFIQNIHHFRDEALRDEAPPVEKVVVFDEAQRAWNLKQASQFMKQKRGYPDFNQSEPAFLISAMDRHDDWCVIVCLIGGGQEINTGEAGLAEWLQVLADQYPGWRVYSSDRLDDPDYIWDPQITDALRATSIEKIDALHLAVSMRSFRAEALSEFVSHVVENRPEIAREKFSSVNERYPMAVTRSLNVARNWLREKARASERIGLLASSGAYRLRPEGIHVKSSVDAPIWFLNGADDVRSSFYLEEVATEFDVQGLELDWCGVCWDADFRYLNGSFDCLSFRGTKWQNINAPERRLFLKNAYRVLLTRARQGMIIYVPKGDAADPTRLPSFYDETVAYLAECGLPAL